MVTTEFTAPLTGVKLVIVGIDNTVKFTELKTVTPVSATVTDSGPVEAPVGTIAVILVVVEAVILA